MNRTRFRIAVLADIHGNLAALKAVVKDFTERGVDTVVTLGDSFSGPLLANETADYLMTQSWTHIAGNHERNILTRRPEELGPSDRYARSQLSQAALAWMAEWPKNITLDQQIFLCHGTPDNDHEYLLESIANGHLISATAAQIQQRTATVAAPVILCGHSHRPGSIRTRSGQWIVNPGSVGLPAYSDDQPCRHVSESGSPDSRYAIIEKKQNGWIVQLLSIPYDFHPMAALAAQQGRQEWQSALLTGYVTGSEK